MPNAYEEMRKIENMIHQAAERFGAKSPECAELDEIRDYWQNEWKREGGLVFAPSAEILTHRIGVARRAAAKHKRETAKTCR